MFLFAVCFDIIISVLKSNPPHWVGENGTAVEIDEDELDTKNELYKLNQFNLLASDRIALNRSLPDVRLSGLVM